MASWVLKAIAQRVIGALPYRELWNEFFQEWVTHSLRLDEQVFEEHLRKDAQHLDYLRKHTREATLTAFTVFELGTGWHPILPIALFPALRAGTRHWTRLRLPAHQQPADSNEQAALFGLPSGARLGRIRDCRGTRPPRQPRSTAPRAAGQKIQNLCSRRPARR